MEKTNRTVGTFILQIALALLFIVSGIWILQGGKGDEISTAIYSIFSTDVSKVLCIIFGVIEIVAGAFLLIRLFKYRLRYNFNGYYYDLLDCSYCFD